MPISVVEHSHLRSSRDNRTRSVRVDKMRPGDVCWMGRMRGRRERPADGDNHRCTVAVSNQNPVCAYAKRACDGPGAWSCEPRLDHGSSTPAATGSLQCGEDGARAFTWGHCSGRGRRGRSVTPSRFLVNRRERLERGSCWLEASELISTRACHAQGCSCRSMPRIMYLRPDTSDTTTSPLACIFSMSARAGVSCCFESEFASASASASPVTRHPL